MSAVLHKEMALGPIGPTASSFVFKVVSACKIKNDYVLKQVILMERCGVAQLVARRLAVRQARVRFSARHHREVFPTELSSGRNSSKWRRIYVLYECD